MKSHFHMRGGAPRLALRKRLKVIRKWPIGRRTNKKDINCFYLNSIISAVVFTRLRASVPYVQGVESSHT